jgi:hypothetical protein
LPRSPGASGRSTVSSSRPDLRTRLERPAGC